ncbi:MAG TPA: serine/threonine-protein kinase, partial [Pirellulales bacterium]
GDYKVIREIGRGGMGVVYEAEQISLGRRVALKVLPFAAVLDDRQIRRFKNEAQAAAQLHHPHIVPVFAVGCDRGTHYYAMQFIEGRTIADFIRVLRGQRDSDHVLAPTEALPGAARRGESLERGERREKVAPRSRVEPSAETPKGLFAACHQRTKCATDRNQETVGDPDSKSAIHSEDYFRRVARIGVEAGEALDHAHEFGVVHRDVKPSNLLLDASGAVWVTDFGLARYQADLNLTMTGELVGTLGYMSPEQARGKRVIDHRTDVYSLGVTLRELLTLEPAFTDAAGQELLRRISFDEPRSPRSLNPDVPIDLETIILKAMAKEPEQRYESARELVDDLQRFLDNKPIRARPPTIIERAIRWGRRHAAVVAGAMAMLCVTSLLLTAASLVIWRAKEQKALALHEAQQQFIRAEANFRQARDIVDTVCVRLSDQLAETPGAEQIRRELLEDALRYHRKFIAQASDEPTLQAELAASYFRVGGITQQIGKSDLALAAYEEAQKLWQKLVEQHPEQKDYSRDLALCLNDVGLLFVQMQREAEAEGAFCQAIARLDKLRHETPGDAALQSGLAMCYNNAGLLYSRTEKRKAARAAYRAATEIQNELVRHFPDEPEHKSDLALTLNNLATLLRESEPLGAEDAYKSAVGLQEKLVKDEPGKLSFQADLAVTYSNLGSLESRLGRPDEAARAYADAIRIQGELIAKAPQQTKHRNDLAVSLNNLGFLQTQEKKLDPAVATFERARAILAQLVTEFPETLTYHSSLGGTYNNLGMALEELGRNQEA